MKKIIWFDMDGTIANLYAVENWLNYLINENPYPYAAAKTMLNFSVFARYLNAAQKNGWKIGIISWGSKKSSSEYLLKVEKAKKNWLMEHLPSVKWNYIKVVPYGTNKFSVCGGGILFDDEENNRNIWGKNAYSPDMIIDILKQLK